MQYLPESQPDPIPDWMTQETRPMTTQHYVPRLERVQKIAIAALLVAALVAIVCAAAYAANTATITFSPSTGYSDGTAYPSGAVVTYDLYQAPKGATKVKVGTVVSGGSISTGLATGVEYCWDVVTVVKIGTAPATESIHSNEACKAFVGAPGVVTITVT